MTNIPVDKPDDMIFDDVSAGPAQTSTTAIRARATLIVKSAIQNYLKEYFEEEGEWRYQIKDIAPYVKQYETGISNTNRDDDTLQELQIARLWTKLRQQLPALIIIDTSFRSNSTGFSGVTRAYGMGQAQGVQVNLDATVGITVRIAAGDDTTAGDLRDTLALIFDVLTKANRSYLIQPKVPQATWEVRLPMAPPEVEGVDKVMMSGDQLDAYYTSAVNLMIDFEGSILLPFEASNGLQQNQISQDVEIIDTDVEVQDVHNLAVNVTMPTVAYLGVPVPINTQYVPYKSYFVSDNPNVILVVDGKRLLPRRIGSCNINLMGERNDLIKSYPVTVTTV